MSLCPTPFAAILFDCDGVLVDSEPLVNRVLVQLLADMGWALTLAEATRLFTGKMVRDQAELIRQHTGVSIDAEWERNFRAHRDQRLQAELQRIPGIEIALPQIHSAMAGKLAVASGADLGKVRMQLAHTGLADYFGAQVYSGQDLAANKPAPDIYLHAATQLGAPIQQCAVIEDSVTGIRAGAAAGATVFGYCPASSQHVSPTQLRLAGAHHIFTDMRDLPARLGLSPKPPHSSF